MKMSEALEIVLDLAEQNALDEDKVDDDLSAEANRQAQALSVVRRSLADRRRKAEKKGDTKRG